MPQRNDVVNVVADTSLTPSILRVPDKGGCGWHGFITNGEVRTA